MIQIIAKKEFAEEENYQKALPIIAEMVQATRTEPGCIDYHFYRCTNHPGQLVFLEQWADEAALSAHLRSEHYLRLKPQYDACFCGVPEVERYELVY